MLCVLQAQGQVQLEARCAGVKQGLGSEGTMTKLYVDGTDSSAMLSSMTAELTRDKNIDAVVYCLMPVVGQRIGVYAEGIARVAGAGSKPSVGDGFFSRAQRV